MNGETSDGVYAMPCALAWTQQFAGSVRLSGGVGAAITSWVPTVVTLLRAGQLDRYPATVRRLPGRQQLPG